MRLCTSLFTVFCFLIVYNVFSEDNAKIKEDSLTTSAITVTAERIPVLIKNSGRTVYSIPQKELNLYPGNSIQDKIQYLPGVDLRQRGASGVQADLSLRGSSFDQVLVLFNGIKMNDIQTGHHNLDFPVDLDAVGSIELLQGGASRTLGPNAFAGAVNIMTPTDSPGFLKINAAGGKYNYYNYGVTFSQDLSHFSETCQGLSLFASLAKKKSDSYIHNTDYNYNNAYAMLKYKSNFGIFDLQGGISSKQFGANSFYTAEYPNQFEETKTLFSALSFNSGTENHLKVDFYWRRHYDKFELFRDNPPEWYTSHNYNRTDVLGSEADYSFHTVIGTSSFGAEYRHEKLFSTNLGEIMSPPIDVPNENVKYTKDGKRDNVNIYFEHSKNIGNFFVSAGMLANYYSDYNWNVYPGLDLNYKISETNSIYGNIHKSLRVPTYTDLYYSDPISIGNPNLKPEKSLSYEVGYRFNSEVFATNVSLFRREGKDLIDWAYNVSDKKWHSMNVTEANTNGIEVECSINMQRLLNSEFLINRIKLSYTYIDVDKAKSDFISEYVMDFMKHKFSADLLFTPINKLSADLKLNYNTRNGNYINYAEQKTKKYGSYFTLDAKFNYNFSFVNLFIDATNITNTKYFAVSNVTMPGFVIKGGISLQFDFFGSK